MTDDAKIKELLAEIEKYVYMIKAQVVLSDAALVHLRAIYATAWIEGSYDPFNDRSHETANTIWPHIKALNDELKFTT